MSKLTELLDELCPDGVQNARFSEVCEYVRGVTYKKDQELPADSALGFKLLRANNITVGANVLNFDEVKVVSPDVKVSERQKLSAGDILICAGSGSKQHIGKVAYIESDMPYTFGGFMAVIRTNGNVDSRYLFHVLTGDMFKNYLQVALTSTTINNLNQRIMGNFAFPVPPLEVQQEIVRVLDAFTDLEQSLVSELELRKKQFASVLDEQVYSATLMEPKGHLVKLGEVAHYTTDRVDSEKLENSQFVGVDNLLPNLSGVRSSTYGPNTKRVAAFEAGDILLGNIRPYLRKMWLSDRSGGCSGDVLPIRINESHSDLVDPKYLYFALASDRFFDFNMQHARGGKMPRGNKSMILEYNFPMPTLETQLEVANRLNALESLIQSIEQEISLRRTQYEFYRDELLSFAPKED